MDNNTEKKDMKLDSEQRVRVLSPGMLVESGSYAINLQLQVL